MLRGLCDVDRIHETEVIVSIDSNDFMPILDMLADKLVCVSARVVFHTQRMTRTVCVHLALSSVFRIHSSFFSKVLPTLCSLFSF